MTARPERLRPEDIRSKPVPMDPVFDDPDAVVDLIRSRAPYPTMLAWMGIGTPGEGSVGIPWFMARPDDDFLVNHPRWFAAAREAFGAEIVRPIHVTLNLNGPSPLGPPHVDQPKFRGVTRDNVPLWMQMAMSRSRLFLPWLAPVAAGLVWFWRGDAGGFEYWPDGPDQPPRSEQPPMWNRGVMSDNEVMWHRVREFGDPGRRELLARKLDASARLHWTGGGWEIRQHDGVLMEMAPDEVRIALLWKAYVFRDGAHLASFEDRRYDLDMAQITGIFRDDLRARSITVREPVDAANDPAWRECLECSYPGPEFAQAADS